MNGMMRLISQSLGPVESVPEGAEPARGVSHDLGADVHAGVWSVGSLLTRPQPMTRTRS